MWEVFLPTPTLYLSDNFRKLGVVLDLMTPPAEDMAASIPETVLKSITRYSGTLSTDAVNAMHKDLPFFAELSADQRAEIQMIVQGAVRDFVTWYKNPAAPLQETIDGFKLLSRSLGKGVSLQQTVQLVRTAMEFFEQGMPRISHDPQQRMALLTHVLRYGRELGFTAADVYAEAAENRGAWDTRMEAMIVDAVVRGDHSSTLSSRASAVNWDASASATVIVGAPSPQLGVRSVSYVHDVATKYSRSALGVVQGSQLVVIVSGPVSGVDGFSSALLNAFSPDAVVMGPTVDSLEQASFSASEALSGLAAVKGWPVAPRPVLAGDLLPERVLLGDEQAAKTLINRVVLPLRQAGAALEETLEAYLNSGGHVEACSRDLFVHANTVRYRLKRVTQISQLDPLDPRDSFVLKTACTLGRLHPENPQ